MFDEWGRDDAAEREARRTAEMYADLIEFDSDKDREAYIEEEYEAELVRLLEEYEKAL